MAAINKSLPISSQPAPPTNPRIRTLLDELSVLLSEPEITKLKRARCLLLVRTLGEGCQDFGLNIAKETFLRGVAEAERGQLSKAS